MRKSITKVKDQKGFTIIEVLIVLAIAGLIILIVLLAVPALQRNSRNTQRKNDISGLLGAYQEEVNNNSGAVPATCDGSLATCFVRNTKTSNYDNQIAASPTGGVSFTKQAAATLPTAVTNTSQVRMYNFVKCNGNAPTLTNATSRSIVILYAVETSGGTPTAQCQES